MPEVVALPGVPAAAGLNAGPGPDLAVALTGIEPDRMTAPDLVRAAAAAERLVAWAQAIQLRVMAELSGRMEVPEAAPEHELPTHDLAVAELAAALRLHRRTAGGRVDLACWLAGRFPSTLALLESGRIDLGRARVIVEELAAVADLDEETCRLVEADALAGAPARTAGQVRREIRRALQILRPEEARERALRRRSERCVRFTPQPDGMTELWALLPAEGAQAVQIGLTAMADLSKARAAAAGVPDPRSHDQRRADELTGMFRALLDGAHLPLVPVDGLPVPPLPALVAGAAAPAAATPARGSVPGSVSGAPGRRTGDPSVPAGTAFGLHRREGHGAAGGPGAGSPVGGTDVRGPNVGGPDVGGPDVGGPDVGGPDVGGPDVGGPDVGGPDVRGPDVRGPDVGGPDLDGLGSVAVSGAPPAWVPPDLPKRQSRAPHLVVLVSLAVLTGAADGPGELAGYGMIPAEVARRIARDAGTYQVACVDERTGRCRSIGRRTQYRPVRSLIDAVVARDPQCRGVGCTAPAVRCDIDHVVPHRLGGPTSECNLEPLCERCHALKHAGWQVAYDADAHGGTGTI